ncbi:hypothetical protein CEF21_05915 [Bacillus sp. FJAT-42376]|nr:hypothetical protein CEF21_05915 [Bacillus sp. FJAT-42376]
MFFEVGEVFMDRGELSKLVRLGGLRDIGDFFDISAIFPIYRLIFQYIGDFFNISIFRHDTLSFAGRSPSLAADKVRNIPRSPPPL